VEGALTVRALTTALVTTALATIALPRTADARPTFTAPVQVYRPPGGAIAVHYVTTTADAVPATDANTNGVPDFVEAVAAAGEDALARYAAAGFRAPLSDAAIADNGGDGRTDIYLKNLVSADGNAAQDACNGTTCIGHATTENDYAGFNYPSIQEAIETVVAHELFHLVQLAYDDDQATSWVEGSAVWAVEYLHGPTNGDFERFLPGFLMRTDRPFERPGGGFGDPYPYGAALWPYFLEHAHGVDAVVATWAACENGVADPDFLEAADVALAERGTTLADAFTEFTRWNLFTGSRAERGDYPTAAASTWIEVPTEPPFTSAATTIYVEGLSARYVPVILPADLDREIVVRPAANRTARAWVVPFTGALADGIELVADATDGALELTIPSSAPRQHYLVVTGLSAGTIASATELLVREPVIDDPPDPPGGGGCASSRGGSSLALALPLLALVARLSRGRSRAGS
jgi:hypothetical protein